MTIKAGVIGYPIKHSLSPRIHNFWLKKYGIDGEYKTYEVKPEDLENFIITLSQQGLAGVNVTLPHKEKIFSLIRENDESADILGAVNTVICNDDELAGFNTDTYGFTENVRKHVKDKDKAVVLGAGGAARAVVLSLIKLGFKEIIITNRTIEKAQKIKQLFDIYAYYKDIITVSEWNDRSEIIIDTDFLVNTTSLGMIGQAELAIDISLLPKKAVVTDIVYNPLETMLLKQAREQENIAIDGLDMLLYQAVPGFRKWFDPHKRTLKNNEPEVTQELRDYVLSDASLS